MNLLKRIFKPRVHVEEHLYQPRNMRIEPYPPKSLRDLLNVFMREYEMPEPPVDSTKPCRFLKEKIGESADAGIPCGVYRYCTHPFFKERTVSVAQQSLAHVRKALRGIDELMPGRAESPIVMSPQATAEMMSDLLAEALNWTDHTNAVLTVALARYPVMEDEKHKKWLTKTAEEERAEREYSTRILAEYVEERLGEKYET